MQTNRPPSLVFFTNETQSYFLVGENTNKGEETFRSSIIHEIPTIRSIRDADKKHQIAAIKKYYHEKRFFKPIVFFGGLMLCTGLSFAKDNTEIVREIVGPARPWYLLWFIAICPNKSFYIISI
jgi:hypothetical protein